jgi:MFS family permease
MTQTAVAPRPGLYYGWVVVGASFLMNVAASPTNAVIFSFFITPMTEDLGWSRGAMSLALLFRMGVAGLTSPFLGALIDRIGGRLLGTLAATIAGLCVMSLAFVHDLWLFYLIFAISGMSGFGGPAGQLLTMVPVAKWFVAKRGRALAIATIGMPLGTALFIPIVQAIIASFGWQTAWIISGVMVLVVAVPSCALLMRKDPESMGLHPDGATESVAALAANDGASAEEDWEVRQVLHTRTFWMLVVYMLLTGLVIQGTLVYRTAFWEDTGLSSDLVAWGTSIDPLTVVFSGLFFGFLAERMSIRKIGLLGGFGVACSMVPMVLATGQAGMLFVHNLLWGFSMGANITVNNVIWPEYYGRRLLGTIRGMVFPVIVGSSAISSPLFALLLGQASEERFVWLVTLTAFIIGGALIFLSRRPPHPRMVAIPVMPAAAAPVASEP